MKAPPFGGLKIKTALNSKRYQLSLFHAALTARRQLRRTDEPFKLSTK